MVQLTLQEFGRHCRAACHTSGSKEAVDKAVSSVYCPSIWASESGEAPRSGEAGLRTTRSAPLCRRAASCSRARSGVPTMARRSTQPSGGAAARAAGDPVLRRSSANSEAKSSMLTGGCQSGSLTTARASRSRLRATAGSSSADARLYATISRPAGSTCRVTIVRYSGAAGSGRMVPCATRPYSRSDLEGFAERRIVSSLSGRHRRPAARRNGSGARPAPARRGPAGACR